MASLKAASGLLGLKPNFQVEGINMNYKKMEPSRL